MEAREWMAAASLWGGDTIPCAKAPVLIRMEGELACGKTFLEPSCEMGVSSACLKSRRPSGQRLKGTS